MIQSIRSVSMMGTSVAMMQETAQENLRHAAAVMDKLEGGLQADRVDIIKGDGFKGAIFQALA